MSATPCAHLIEASPIHQRPVCELGRGFPDECLGCSAYSPGLTEQERTRCEVWTRVMGYHRPTHAFNPGKQSEHAERRYYVDRPGDLRPNQVVAPVGDRQQVVMPPPGAVTQPSPQTPRAQPLPPANPQPPSYTFAEGHGDD